MLAEQLGAVNTLTCQEKDASMMDKLQNTASVLLCLK